MSHFPARPAITLAATLILAACATPEPRERVVVQRVEVPVYQPCEITLDPPSALPVDAEPPVADIFAQMQAALASISLLRADLKEARAAAEGCSGQP